jgi:hypothetical protein
MENKPAVEFASGAEDKSEPAWWVFGGIGLIAGGLAVVAALPGMWEDQIVGNTSRRGRAISSILESIGFVPTISILGGIAAICLIIAAISFLKWRRNEGQE